MIVAITGTPGTGKTSVSKILQKKGFEIIDLNQIACEKKFLMGEDEKRKSQIIDIEKLNKYFKKIYTGKNIVFIEGHLSHLLKTVDKVIILRCHPNQLKKNLVKKGWKEDKIRENLEAEILDIILCESIENHIKNNIFEIDTTNKSIDSVTYSIIEIVNKNFKNIEKFKLGKIDWSEEILHLF